MNYPTTFNSFLESKGISKFYVSNKKIARYEEAGSKQLTRRAYEQLDAEFKSFSEITQSDVNTLIAALLLTSSTYESRGNAEEADRYKALEYKFREYCYNQNKKLQFV